MPYWNIVYTILGRNYVDTIYSDFDRIRATLSTKHDVHISQIKVLTVTLVQWKDI